MQSDVIRLGNLRHTFVYSGKSYVLYCIYRIIWGRKEKVCYQYLPNINTHDWTTIKKRYVHLLPSN